MNVEMESDKVQLLMPNCKAVLFPQMHPCVNWKAVALHRSSLGQGHCCRYHTNNYCSAQLLGTKRISVVRTEKQAFKTSKIGTNFSK